jgi:hypothetical protein
MSRQAKVPPWPRGTSGSLGSVQVGAQWCGAPSDPGSWGDSHPPLQQGILRIGFANVNGLWAKKDENNALLHQFIWRKSFDMMGIQEVNLHWKKVAQNHSMYERTRNEHEAIHLSLAYYKDYEPLNPFQPGGVALMSLNKMAFRVMDHGQDARLLGHWAWTRLWGRSGITLQIVTGYRPNKSVQNLVGAWSQQ